MIGIVLVLEGLLECPVDSGVELVSVELEATVLDAELLESDDTETLEEAADDDLFPVVELDGFGDSLFGSSELVVPELALSDD